MILDLIDKNRWTLRARMCHLELLSNVLYGINKVKSLKTPLKSIFLVGIPTAASY
jgi:hypothetical protein